jgi:hypothetical protein
LASYSGFGFTPVFAAVSLDLQSGVMDVEALLEVRRNGVEQRIFGAAIRHHQMRSQGDAGGA